MPKLISESDVKLKQIRESSERLRCSAVCKTLYSVEHQGRLIGYVWSEEGFSYRGTQGWNRGIRLRDYRPTEWHFGVRLGISVLPCPRVSRKLALKAGLFALNHAKWY